MKRSEFNAVLAALAQGIKSQVRTVVSKGDRQSAGGLEVVKENFSLTRFLRGVALHNWTDAPDEQKLFQKALSAENGSTGGLFVPTVLSGDIIELLKEKAVIRNLPGVRVMPLTSMSMEWNAIDTGPTISWGTENATLTEDTALAFGDKKLELKKAVCLYKSSRELLDNASTDMDALLRRELADAMALADDKVILEGTGGTQPLGLYFHPLINNTDLSGVVDTDDFKSAVYQVRTNGYKQITAWVGHPRTKQTLSKEKDSIGRYIYGQGPGVSPTASFLVEGAPFVDTTQVGITLRPSADESYVIGADWSQLIIGEKPGLRIETTDTGGDAFIYDQVWLKLVRFVGYSARQAKAFVVIKGIQS